MNLNLDALLGQADFYAASHTRSLGKKWMAQHGVEFDDLKQEALARVFEYLNKKYDPDKGSIPTFTKKHLSGAILDYRRKHCGGQKMESFSFVNIEDYLNNTAMIFEAKEYDDAPELINKIVRKMPRKSALLLRLTFWDELTQKEIAKVIGLSQTWVCMELAQAKRIFAGLYLKALKKDMRREQTKS